MAEREPAPELVAKAMAISSARWALAADRLAKGLAARAVTAPGGTRWPGGFELPREHTSYAIVGFEYENVIGGGPDPAQARTALAVRLLELALEIPEEDEQHG